MSKLLLRNINKSFEIKASLFKSRRVQVLFDINLDLLDNEIVALVGTSGGGKSTIANIILKLIEPDSGVILFDNNDVTKIKGKELKKYRSEVQLIFQDPYSSLDPTHDVYWHISRPLILHGESNIKQKVASLLQEVYLTPPENYMYKYPHQLSGGLRQRVYIARALAVNPKILVADEPVSMLDASIRAGILELMKDLVNERGISMLYITHDLATVNHVARRLYVIQNGRIVESGNVKNIINNPQNDYTKKLLEAAPDPFKRI
ncbi:ABC transporter ATP-binding protein [Picrophilus oshimae]|uniref:Oligopeptide ABC transporter Opp2, ATP binding protein n=1 Tax=Picrophilus torridus (strain ATCC 700027 / DSM 9790 / JCM 10055 / NBRC 100828 / KAW 2/3) TaxID=1122961 RepID=Q6KZ16_PICTO|nr:ATP-binding cassette domain-containing protein [Picrophilus oshimae]AAT44036.1 oligopeptide ABC transporter Opp2, ATP binding protein [Picrophilus oshimae DSM 9789]